MFGVGQCYASCFGIFKHASAKLFFFFEDLGCPEKYLLVEATDGALKCFVGVSVKESSREGPGCCH